MAGGLFELRKDEITGWWVAVVVDREFERTRFARRAEPLPQRDGQCANCEHPPGDGVRVRMLKTQAFTVAGTQREARESGLEDRDRGLGLVGELGSWRTIVAPPGHHGPLAAEDGEVVREMLRLARDAVNDAGEAGLTAYFQLVQNWGRQAGAMSNHLCFDYYDLPQIPHRVGEELGGAARYLIREGVCPFCRLVRDEVASRERLLFEDGAAVAFAPYAPRSPFEVWVVPRHHEADFGRASDAQVTSAALTLQAVLKLLDVLDGPPYNLVLHTAPLRERVDETYHWHWEIHPRLREIGGLELGTGLPVNPVSPEEAVAELRAGNADRGADAPEPRARAWDEYPREATR